MLACSEVLFCVLKSTLIPIVGPLLHIVVRLGMEISAQNILVSIACGEYASRTLTSKHAPSMAKTIAIDSKQFRRAKPEGSPELLCASGPHFWSNSSGITSEISDCVHGGHLDRLLCTQMFIITHRMQKAVHGSRLKLPLCTA